MDRVNFALADFEMTRFDDMTLIVYPVCEEFGFPEHHSRYSAAKQLQNHAYFFDLSVRSFAKYDDIIMLS